MQTAEPEIEFVDSQGGDPEPASQEPGYACLLIPAAALSAGQNQAAVRRLDEVCRERGWTLASVNAQADRLEWGIVVPPSISPAAFMHIIREETCAVLGTGPFWADGYLVSSGLGTLSEGTTAAFAKMVRAQQEKKELSGRLFSA